MTKYNFKYFFITAYGVPAFKLFNCRLQSDAVHFDKIVNFAFKKELDYGILFKNKMNSELTAEAIGSQARKIRDFLKKHSIEHLYKQASNSDHQFYNGYVGKVSIAINSKDLDTITLLLPLMHNDVFIKEILDCNKIKRLKNSFKKGKLITAGDRKHDEVKEQALKFKNIEDYNILKEEINV